MIEPGRESDEVFDLLDLFGTALHLAGVSQDKLRVDDWKAVFMENRGQAFGVWRELAHKTPECRGKQQGTIG